MDATGVDGVDETSNEGTGAGPAGADFQPVLDLMQAHLERLQAESDRLRQLAKPLARWGKPGALLNFGKLEKELSAWKADLAKAGNDSGNDAGNADGLAPVVEEIEKHLVAGKQMQRKRLGLELKQATAAAGLKLKVVSREDPVELRIPPLAVRMDLDVGKVDLLFAKQVVHTCPATAQDILASHATTVRKLERDFDPEAFFEQCWVAYKMGLAATGKKRGDRLELADFLSHLASRMQGKAFFVDPVASNYRGYSRGQFAFDVNRLRQARALAQNGRRMNFGVATGTTATKKGRVIYMEDEYGQGEYKLTIYFTEGN